MALNTKITLRGVETTYHIILKAEADKVLNRTKVLIGSYLDKDARTADLRNFIPANNQIDYSFIRFVDGIDLTFEQIYTALTTPTPQTIIDTPEVLARPQWTDPNGVIVPAVEAVEAVTHIVEMNEFAGATEV